MKLTMKREYFLPKGAIKVADKKSDAVAYLYTKLDSLGAIVFYGKAAKPVTHFTFRDEARRAKCVENSFVARRDALAAKARYKAERLKPSTLEAGHILRTCWGYDQTNVDFYQVIAVKGERTVVVQKLASMDAGSNCSMSGYVVPSDKLVGEPKTCRVSYGSSVTINGHHANVWEGKPAFTSSWH
jgi:hypothetical protein